MPRIRTINRWFDRHIQEDASGCWIWNGSRTLNGYGQVRVPGCSSMAHRAIYEYMVAEVPATLDLDHLCRTRACVNPWHLEPVTRSVNLRRGNTARTHNTGKTHCPQGHLYDAENTAVRNGRRNCRTCERVRAQRAREARRAD